MTRPQIVYIEREERPNHVLHLLLSLITFGFWIPIWFLVSLKCSIKRDWQRKGRHF